MHKKLFIPGPTEVKKEVLEAQTEWMIGHRTKEFSELLERVTEKIKKALNTKANVFIFTSSATGVMEGTIRNVVKTKYLGTVCGAFSSRWYKIGVESGKEGDKIEVEWGKAIKPEMIEEKLKSGKYDTLLLTYNETSTGVMNPLADIGEVMKKYPDVIFAVDAVSAMMGAPIKFEEWGIDVIFASVQKCFALPPGLTVALVSDKALERAKTVEGRGYYFDFIEMAKRYNEKRQTTATPAISLIYALDKQMDRILEEGIENRYRRHQEMAEYTQKWAMERGFEMFPEKGYWSPTVSTIKNTKGYSVADLNKELGKRGLMISNGYGKLKEITFRIGHMGDHTLDDVKEVLEAIDEIWNLK